MDKQTPEFENIIITCDECNKNMYPNAGKFTEEQVRKADAVKVNFNREHMWVRVRKVYEDAGTVLIEGVVANVPAKRTSPKYGAVVKIALKDVEDVAE